MTQFWGSFQRFEYQELSLQLSLGDYVYRPGDGDSNLERIGYDRYADPQLDVDIFYGYNGASHIEGAAHPSPNNFFWNLQFLLPDQADLLFAMIRRSRADKAPIRLYDGLLLFDEKLPRTRAKVGAHLELRYGLAWFFPIFDIWLSIPAGQQTRRNGRHYLRLEGREWNPHTPVPISADAVG